MSRTVAASWSVSLNCDCPFCGEYVDLMLDSDQLETVQPCEADKELEVFCPECGENFTIKTEY